MVLFFFQGFANSYQHSGFVLRMVLDGTEIKFEPTFTDFEVVLLNVFDVMIKAVSVVPRVETKLYSEWVSWNCKYKDSWYFYTTFV